MFYRRKHYIVVDDFVAPLNELFSKVNLPNQLKHGARLVGRWMIPLDGGVTEIFAIWEYDSVESYRRVEEKVRGDRDHVKRIQEWYASHGGKARVFETQIREVRDEEITFAA